MLHNVDTQVDGWYMRKYMRVDSTLYTNENPIFPREVYMDRLRRLPNIVEMPYNDVVQDYINHYTGPLASLGELHAGRAKLLCAAL